MRRMPIWGVAARFVAMVLAITAVFGLVGVPADAGTPCRTSGPSYTVTVCFTEPADGATLTGIRTVTTTVTVNGTNPGVNKLLYYLGGTYLLTDYSAPYSFSLPTNKFVDGLRALEVEAVMRDGFITQRSSVDLTFANGITQPPVNTNTFTPASGSTPAPGRPFVLAAVGDGASGRPEAQAVTDLITSWSPNMFLYLGDVYEQGTPTEFYNWYGTPDWFFGRLRAITNPTIGNHENLTPNSAGYFDYWDNVPNYFSFNVAGWHVVSLDSTGVFGQTSPSSAQYQWLDQDLSSSSAACDIVFFHHPRWSVGQSAGAGDSDRMASIWTLLAQRGVDLVLNGHDHNYQRWQPLNGSGVVSASGPTEFVVGSGGHGIQTFTGTDSRLARGFDSLSDFGALKLEINQHGAAFQFINMQGTTLDSGSVGCSGVPADSTAPAAPTNLTAVSPGANSVDLTWTSSTDNVGVTGYDIYRNGSLLTTTGPAPTFTDSTVAANTTYQYSVRARDAAGNVSGPSNTATVTTLGTNPPLFTDDFETGDLSKWTGNTGLVAQQQEVFAGTWAARGTTTGASTWAYKSLGTTHTELYYRIRFKVMSQGAEPTNTVNLLKLRTATGTAIFGLYRNPAGNLGYRNEVAPVSTTSSTPVSTGVWHEVQVRVRINGASGETETWFDGVRIAALSKTEDFGTTPIGRIQIGENSTGRNFDVAFDEVAAGTSFISDGGPSPDTTPPSDPTSLNASAISSSRVDLTWAGSTDNVGVTGYDIYRNGSPLLTIGAVTSHSDTTVAPSTTYQYQVRARDAAGNLSGFSNTATVTTPAGPALQFVVRREGTNYVAESQTATYTGDLKTVVESAVYNDLNPAGGGRVTFQAGVFDLGATYLRLEEVSDIIFEGQGMDVTAIQNSSNAADDTEPFNFKGAYRVVIRDLTVSAGGTPRTTSDAIDFDKGNDSLVQRVKITYSRGKGIIFDGKDAGWTSQGNTVLDCEISGTNNDGIQFLASTNNRVEGCFIHDTVMDGIEATKSQSNAPQPHKKSNDNVIIGNTIDNAGQNGIRIHSSDRNLITGNYITNSADDTANHDGIRIICDESITGDDNIVSDNTSGDNQATHTQRYGLNISNSLCNRTVVWQNTFFGNLNGDINDLGTDTRYTAPAAADLALTKTDPPGRAPTGRDMTYTLTVNNLGPDAAAGVTIVDQLPPSVTFVSATPTQGTCQDSGGTVTCNLGTISNGAIATVAIVVKPTVPGTITNTASVGSSTHDPNEGNNADSEVTSVCRITSRRSSIPCG
ncbi:MAG TPA: right-handed parallel beta-helix repeat-containing protein, partial [Actinomycetota bacterium]|nr:right-handed parallel beta-helix repeat-containing protein [Actinomycetota bacterium]